MIAELFHSKKGVAVWGLGYLGYTTVSTLQEHGLSVRVHDLNDWVLDLFKDGGYPSKEMASMWSDREYVPPLDTAQAVVCDDPLDMFNGAGVHMVTMPLGQQPGVNRLQQLARWCLERADALRARPPLVIFTSAYVPGYVDAYFIRVLAEAGLEVGRDFHVATAFRSDWVVEEYFSGGSKLVVGADGPGSLALARAFFEALGQDVLEVNSIREAEVLENARRAFRFLATGFINQLSLGYDGVHVKRLVAHLAGSVNLSECVPNMGAGGYKEPFAVQHLLEGADKAKHLTLLTESQATNFAIPLHYAQYLLRQGVKTVAVLGVTFKAKRRDITLSPSITLISYLLEQGVKVLVHDPVYPPEELAEVVPGAACCSLEEALGAAEAVALMIDHRAYRAVAEEQLLGMAGTGVRIIVDNTGLWSGFRFPENIVFHEVGDGSIRLQG